MITLFLSNLLANIVVQKPENIPALESEQLVDGTLEIVFAIIGSISLLMLVLAGLRYVVSGGNKQQVEDARNSIIYALVGLVISLTAWSLVHFVIDRVIVPTSQAAELSSVTELLANIAGFIALIGGIIATIVVIVAGLRLIFSDGNPEEARSARNTIIYALVGLVVCATAGPIISFVLEKL